MKLLILLTLVLFLNSCSSSSIDVKMMKEVVCTNVLLGTDIGGKWDASALVNRGFEEQTGVYLKKWADNNLISISVREKDGDIEKIEMSIAGTGENQKLVSEFHSAVLIHLLKKLGAETKKDEVVNWWQKDNIYYKLTTISSVNGKSMFNIEAGID